MARLEDLPEDILFLIVSTTTFAIPKSLLALLSSSPIFHNSFKSHEVLLLREVLKSRTGDFANDGLRIAMRELGFPVPEESPIDHIISLPREDSLSLLRLALTNHRLLIGLARFFTTVAASYAANPSTGFHPPRPLSPSVAPAFDAAVYSYAANGFMPSERIFEGEDILYEGLVDLIQSLASPSFNAADAADFMNYYLTMRSWSFNDSTYLRDIENQLKARLVSSGITDIQLFSTRDFWIEFRANSDVKNLVDCGAHWKTLGGLLAAWDEGACEIYEAGSEAAYQWDIKARRLGEKRLIEGMAKGLMGRGASVVLAEIMGWRVVGSRLVASELRPESQEKVEKQRRDLRERANRSNGDCVIC